MKGWEGDYKDRWTDTDRQQGNFISLHISFQNKESRLRKKEHVSTKRIKVKKEEGTKERIGNK
jgi:hypothetical protein